MALEVGKTRIALTSRALTQLGARAVVRLFPSLDELERCAREGAVGAHSRPEWPGAAVVRPMALRPGAFHIDFCLEWRAAASASTTAERELLIARALEQVGRNLVVEARRWGCPDVAVPLVPAAPAGELDRSRMQAFCAGLVSALKQPGATIDAIWVLLGAGDAVRKQVFGEELLAALGRRPTRPRLPVVNLAAPASPSAPARPLAPESPAPPAPMSGPSLDATPHDMPAPITLSSDGTFVETRLDERFMALAHDDAISSRMPHPIAVTWHFVTRRVAAEARLQALLHAGEVALRTLGGLLLADYLRGTPEAGAQRAIAQLVKPTLGQWGMAVDAVGGALLKRREPPFYAELGDWLSAREDDAKHLTRALVELRNAIQHGRRGIGRGAAEIAASEAEDLLRQLFDSLRWLEPYRIVVAAKMDWTRHQTFRGRLVVYRGRERYPRLRPAEWRGGLATDGCYVVSPDRRAALDLAPFFATHPEAGTGDETLLVVEALPKLAKARLRQPGGATVCDIPVAARVCAHDGADALAFWAGEQTDRLVALELIDGDLR